VPQIKRLSVVLPVLNERDNLAELIPELCQVLDAGGVECEILVVDDSSTDGTTELVTEFARRDPRVLYLRREGKVRSLPASISEGVAAAKYEDIAWMDADGSMPPATLMNLVDAYRSATSPDVVIIGSRFVKGGGFKGIETVGETRFWQVARNLRNSNDSLSAVFLSRLLNRYLWFTLERCCRDLASGFIVAKRDLVQRIGLHGSYGDYCVRFIYLAFRAGHPLVEIPYVCQVRRHGYSKTGTTLWGLTLRGLPYLAIPLRVRRTSPR